MRKIAHLPLLIFLVLAGCVSAPKMPPKESCGFRAVPPELTGVDWQRTPDDVLHSPAKDEPLIWLGLVKGVSVNHKDGKFEIEWYCEHLAFAEPGPAAISIRPIKAREGHGYFALSLILEDMTAEQAMKFKREHTESPHYMLVGGTFAGIVERNGRQIPFLYTLHLAWGRTWPWL
jgi:hypothetical protein